MSTKNHFLTVLLFLFATVSLQAQTLTISNGGETGTAGTNWSISGTTLTATGTADVNVSVIVSMLSSGAATITAPDIVISGAVTSSSSGILTLRTTSGGIIIHANITRSGSGGLTLRPASGSVTGTGNLILGANNLTLNHGTTVSNNIQLAGGNTVVLLDLEVEYFIVAGGGGGGYAYDSGPGGGGGAGGVLSGGLIIPANTGRAVTVGAGGTGGTTAAGQNGGNSSLADIVAIGGGGGGASRGDGLNGGSGGGAGARPLGDNRLGGTGTSGQGFNGGDNLGNLPGTIALGGSGGGGATAAGGASTTQVGAAGGAGILFNISGTGITYARGGAGGSSNTQSNGAAATVVGGGGDGASHNTNGGPATAGGAGAAGIVIVRYIGSDAATGGTESTITAGGLTYRVHSFSSNGTFVPNALQASIAGNISGSGNIDYRALGGVITVSGNNTYTGSTTLSTGTIRTNHVNAFSTSSAVGMSTNVTLRLELLQDLTVASILGGNSWDNFINLNSFKLTTGSNNLSGTLHAIINGVGGQFEKTGTGTLMFNNGNQHTYSGNTIITGGQLVMQQNNPNPTSKTITGTGSLVIQPASASFSSAFSTSGWSFASTLTGFTIGKPGNTQNLTLANAISVAGPVTVFGGSIGISNAITSTASGAAVALHATHDLDFNVPADASITTNNGNITLVADANADGGGNFFLGGMRLNAGSGNIVIRGHAFIETSGAVTATGRLTIEPSGASFGTNPLSTTIFSIPTTLSGLTLGKPGNATPVTLASGFNVAGSFAAYGATVTLNGNISASNGGDISFYANTLNLGAHTLSSSGTLVLAPQSTSGTIGVAGASGTLQLPASFFSTNFSDGFSAIQIGDAQLSGTISINPFTLRDDMSFITSGALNVGGKLLLGQNNVTLGAAISAINTGTPANYFQTNGTGRVFRNIAQGSALSFPVGHTHYNPVSITNRSGSGQLFSVRVLDGVFMSGTTGPAFSTPHVSATWDISNETLNAGAGVDFSFQWDAAQELHGIQSFRLNHYGSAWTFASGSSGPATGTTTKTMLHTNYTGSFSPFAISSAGGTLPVTWLHFSAQQRNKTVALSWATASEQHNSHFEIERGSDIAGFKMIGKVQATTNPGPQNNYSFVDLRPEAGKQLYRLKQVDSDGTFQYSKTVVVHLAGEPDVNVLAAPGTSTITVLIPARITGNFEMSIFDAAGREVQRQQLVNGTTVVDNSKLKAGIYLIRIVQGNRLLYADRIVR